MARKRTAENAPSAPSPPQPGSPEGLMPGRLRLGLLAGIILVYLILAGAYNAVTPFSMTDQHNPDENAHLLSVEIVASGHLPVFRVGGADYEAHQPPLYYALCAPVYLAARSGGEETAAKAVRWVSTLIGAVLIIVTYSTVLALLPEWPSVALASAAFIGWLPMNVSLSASVTNDSLTDLVFAVALWLVVKMAVKRLVPRVAIALGVLLGIGIWTKTSTLLLFPTVAFAFYLMSRRHLMTGRLAMRSAAVSLGLGLLLGLPWLLRNQVLYGDPLAQHLFMKAFQTTATADVMLPAYGSLTGYLSAVALWTFASFWGGFDSMRVFWGQDPQNHSLRFYLSDVPGPVYAILAVLSAAALIGLGRLRQSGVSAVQRVALWIFTLLIGLTWLAHLRFVLVFFQAQGRYWYPALVPLALLFTLGWRGLLTTRRAFSIGASLFASGLLILNLYTLFGLLLPRFAGQ